MSQKPTCLSLLKTRILPWAHSPPGTPAGTTVGAVAGLPWVPEGGLRQDTPGLQDSRWAQA